MLVICSNMLALTTLLHTSHLPDFNHYSLPLIVFLFVAHFSYIDSFLPLANLINVFVILNMIIPQAISSWEAEFRKQDIEEDSIHRLQTLSSASEISEKQFFLLRVIWTVESQRTFSTTHQHWLDNDHYTKAKSDLEALNNWPQYLKSLGQQSRSSDEGYFPDLGTFSLVSYYQYAVEQRGFTEQSSSKTSQICSPISSRIRAKRTVSTRLDSAAYCGSPISRKGNTLMQEGLGNLGDEMEDLTLGDLTPVSKRSPPGSAYKLDNSSPIGAEDAKFYLPTEDEQIVNTALILFLNAITIHTTPNAD